jgi:hypothetical protein
MKKNILLFLLIFLGNLLQVRAQKNSAIENKFVNEANLSADQAIKDKNPQSYEDFLVKNIPPSEKTKAWTHIRRAMIWVEIDADSLKNNEVFARKFLNKFLAETQIGIDGCFECSIKYRIDRLDEIKDWKLKKDNFSKNELNELKKLGYKEDKNGLALGPTITQNNGLWLGAEMSLWTFYEPFYRIVGIDPVTKKKTLQANTVFSPQLMVFPISFAINPTTKNTDFSASIFQINAPLMVNITKFGYRTFEEKQFNPLRVYTKKIGFYRPEIGIGFNNFSLNYSYTAYFKKVYRDSEQAHGVTLRYIPVIGKYK